MMLLRASVHHGHYGTTLLGSIGGAVSLAILGELLATAIMQHARISAEVGFRLFFSLLGSGIWLGSILGGMLLLWWRGAGGVLATAVRLALLIPIAVGLTFFLLPQIMSPRAAQLFFYGLIRFKGGVPRLFWFLSEWTGVLLVPTLLARAWALAPQIRRFHRS